ncbi:DUF4760 domain-containing protein [Pseudomonas aeruginosa]|uniref:DUF4760 domain-containing protein n=1 Tax=Pseudomonas aeruginosa TaxID=287 RepID=UPI00053E7022|nr:DUF4760 domain-containing protein [Pseudomonas aeruginosa]WAK43826.1 hypothetical protein zjk6_28 [Pseudomonas phage zjk6]DBA08374.1 TPA_asm: hypothetical protein [Pseudomonas phage vB_PaeS-D14E]EKJ8517043.1 DUF4760 domain-containing protein [Pseudomonas aeruginosa]ELP0273435.1 DUF4760 domain-containing protein [Pseudomonas aeruginosa]KSP69823.1 DUF4760 domain-containing protein [Pseudomonas aeruginosa]
MCSAIIEFLASELFRNLLVLTGVIVAIVSVLSAKATAKRKQTADLMFGTRSDQELSKGYRRLQALHNADDSNMRAYAREDRRESEEANEIRYVLNHWERICVGINQGIYCEKMLREANYSTVMKLYEQAEPFIRAIREIEKKKTFYQELEKLHSKWVKKPLAEKK